MRVAADACFSLADIIHSAVEHERLDAQAAAIVQMIGGSPFLALIPILTAPSKAVDVGCGTGVATLQMASMLPSTTVYGLDISIVPEATQKKAPANVVWAVGNVLDLDYSQPAHNTMMRDIFTPQGLDYIFGRMLFLGINDWPRYFSTVHKSLKSGGIIEHQDLDWKFYRVGTSECLSDEWDWHQRVVKGAEESGLSTHAGSGAAQLMEAAGLQVCSVRTFEFSFVPSEKTPNSQAMGQYVQDKLVPQYPELLRRMLGSTCDDLERLTKDCLRAITCEEGVHQKYTVTIAKKP